jgi:hypothetical protein
MTSRPSSHCDRDFQIARLLLDAAKEDIVERQKVCFSQTFLGHAHIAEIQVSVLLQDIRTVRMSKVESGLGKLTGRRLAVKLNNVSYMELNTIRSMFVK